MNAAQKRSATTCPVCKKLISGESAAFPFCSDRCKLIDLGAWASERYRIPAEKIDQQTNSRNDSENED